jgi:hypothetical protein
LPKSTKKVKRESQLLQRHEKAKLLEKPRGENRDIWPARVQSNKKNILLYKPKNIKKHTQKISEPEMFFNLTFFVQLFAIL